jgi:hypothetical protein
LAKTLSPTTTTAASTTSSGGAGGGSRGISRAAAAGISVGSAVGALLLAGVFVFVYALGRRRRLAENPSVAHGRIEKNNVPVNTTVTAPEFSLPEMPGHPN